MYALLILVRRNRLHQIISSAWLQLLCHRCHWQKALKGSDRRHLAKFDRVAMKNNFGRKSRLSDAMHVLSTVDGF